MQELIEELKTISTAVSKENNMDMVAAFSYAIDMARFSIKKEKEQMLNFYMWMRMNENTEKYLDYSDEDMFSEYLKQKI